MLSSVSIHMYAYFCKKQHLQPIRPLLLSGEKLEKVDTYNTADMSWSPHIFAICAKARTILGLIYRQFYGNADQDTIKQLYISLVRPHLEYGSQVWDTYLPKDRISLENVQKFGIASAQWDKSYEDLSHMFNLQTLQECRLHAKLGLLYKLIHKLCFFLKIRFTIVKLAI